MEQMNALPLLLGSRAGTTPSSAQSPMSGLVVVSRTMFRRADDVAACLDDLTRTGALERIPLADAGWLLVERSLGPVSSSGSWRARARLKGRRTRLARSISIEISVTEWSSRASELTVRPTTRRCGQWGARRFRRYVHLAHLAGDQLAATLRCPDPAEMHTPAAGERWEAELSPAA